MRSTEAESGRSVGEPIQHAPREPRRGSTSALSGPGELSLDLQRHHVSVGGREVNLTRRGFDLLAQLLEHQGRVVSNEELLSSVWRETSACQKAVRKSVV